MRLYTDNLFLRIGGTIMGLTFIAIGAFALIGVGGDAEVAAPERVSWLGITAVIAGVAAIGFSWFEQRIDKVFSASRGSRSRRDRRR